MNAYRTLSVLLIPLLAPLASGAEADNELARKAYTILKTNCYRCHGVEFKVAGFNVLDRESLVRSRGPEEDPYVWANNAEKSYLYSQVSGNAMPPSNSPERKTFSEADAEVLKEWIEAGAPFPVAGEERKPVAEASILRRILRNLDELKESERQRQHYFSLAHLHNNPAVTDEDLRLHRAALMKLLASLSRNATLPVVPGIDESGEAITDAADALVYRIDLDELGWTEEAWRGVLEQYPYGVNWTDDKLREIQNRITSSIGEFHYDGVPYIRADWFIAHASTPKHYHALLGTPATIRELEKQLGIDVERDFNNNRLKRAGFAPSGVSKNNRLIDRHAGGTQYYYRSYDFASSIGRKLLYRFPLGPDFKGNKFSEFAFQADGGEVVYRLPNGMIGYMIIDGQGKRLDEAPVDIVRDVKEHANTVKVLNGISCIGCHRHGLQPFEDRIRNAPTVGGAARGKVSDLYPDAKEMAAIVAKDKKDFLATLEQVIGPYLKLGDDADKKIEEFPEPVHYVVQNYHKDLTVEVAGYELDYDGDLKAAIKSNRKLQDLGLGPIATGGAIPRSLWESKDTSSDVGQPKITFHAAVAELGLGDGAELEKAASGK